VNVLGAIRLSSLAVAAALLAAFVGFERWHQVMPVAPPASLGIPESVGKWRLTFGATLRSELETLEFDKIISGNYVASDAGTLNLFIGYFERQIQGRELAGYRMRALLGGQHPETFDIGDGHGEARDYVTETPNGWRYVTHWYMIGGRRANSAPEAKLITAWNSVVHRRTDAALIAVTIPIHGSEGRTELRARVAEFVRGIETHLRPSLGTG
jgi:EpsI family protein